MDGKSFSFDKSFAFQTVGLDTQVLTFDDVKERFDFESLFSVITEGITIERKNKDAIKLEYEDSPKIVITTNYAIKGGGNSFERRKFDIEFFQHYKKDFTPRDDFNRNLFSDWDGTDWSKFDAYMIFCLQRYLSEGLVQSVFTNLNVRRLSAETSHSFIEWLGLTADTDDGYVIPDDKRIYCKTLYNDFVSDYPDYGDRGKWKLTKISFNRWLDKYGKYRGNYHMGRDAKGKFIIFHHIPEND